MPQTPFNEKELDILRGFLPDFKDSNRQGKMAIVAKAKKEIKLFYPDLTSNSDGWKRISKVSHPDDLCLHY